MKYPDEVRKYITSLAPTHTNPEIAEMVNAKWPVLHFKSMNVKNCRNKWKLPSSGRRAKAIRKSDPKFPEGFYEWMLEVNEGRESSEVFQMAKEKWPDWNITLEQIRAYKKNHKIRSGVDTKFKQGQQPMNEWTHKMLPIWGANHRFQKGNAPHNKAKVGDLVKRTDGYWKRKIAEPDVWEFEHILIYESIHGKLEPGYKVIFLDGNIDNLSPDNLMKVSLAEHLEMNRQGLRSEDADVTESGVHLARLAVKIYEMEKK